ncbi:MAG: hypothetical protein ACJ8DK_24190 [Microvirga sp.]
MAAAKLLIDRVIPSRRRAPVSFHIRPLMTPEDCALAYADLLDDVGAGRLTPEEAQTIAAIVAKRAELFASVELAAEIEALKAQLAAVVGRPPPAKVNTAAPPSIVNHSTIIMPQGDGPKRASVAGQHRSAIDALKAQLAAVSTCAVADPPRVRDHLTATGPQPRNDLLGLTAPALSLAQINEPRLPCVWALPRTSHATDGCRVRRHHGPIGVDS